MTDASPAPRPQDTAPAPPLVPGYDLLEIVGRGGMGVVWRAREHRLDRDVALKVHSGMMTAAVAAEMWSEARLTARIAHPGIVAVHDFGETLEGRPYYTMDMVDGTDLAALIGEGSLPQARALSIAADVARAVAAAHERGIIHRDLKPRNVLIDSDGHARVLDFGIAVSLDRAQPDTEENVRGTPPYMSPEHLQGFPTGAPTDVYAIGVILFEMLTGRRPFLGTDALELALKIVQDPPPAPSSLCEAVHRDVDRVCLRCLAKSPDARYPTARGLAESLTAVLEGRPLPELEGMPVPRPRRAGRAAISVTRPPEGAPIHFRRSWTMRSSPAALWHHVANTERFNKAIGQSSVKFTDTPDPDGGSKRTGNFRVFGMNVTWDEHPFEWLRGREHSVHRRYKSGPLEALWNQVRLSPGADGGTELTHEIWAIPTGRLASLAASFEIRQAVSAMDAVYRRVDAALAETSGRANDPFEEPHRPTASQRERVESGASRLEHEAGLTLEVVRPLSALLLEAPDKVIETMRPFALADAWGAGRDETLELFLLAAHAGLVELAWDLVCPECLVAHERAASLSHVRRTGACETCNKAPFERDLASTVELVFRPHPAVRPVTAATYCAGSPAMRPHILAQQILAPGEHREIALELARGGVRLVAPALDATWALDVSPVGFEGRVEVRLEPGGIDASPGVVRTGEVTFSLENATDTEQVVRLEGSRIREDAVTAALALSHPAFNELFSEELLAHGEHVTVSRMAFLWFEVQSHAELITQHGDARALSILAEVERLAREAVRGFGGAVLDGSLHGAALATFGSSAHAVQAGLALQRALAAAGAAVEVRAAVHEGRCLALRHAARIEYFGETLERGAALLPDCQIGELVVSGAVAEDRTALAAARAEGARFEAVTSARGPYGGRRVLRIALDPS